MKKMMMIMMMMCVCVCVYVCTGTPSVTSMRRSSKEAAQEERNNSNNKKRQSCARTAPAAMQCATSTWPTFHGCRLQEEPRAKATTQHRNGITSRCCWRRRRRESVCPFFFPLLLFCDMQRGKGYIQRSQAKKQTTKHSTTHLPKRAAREEQNKQNTKSEKKKKKAEESQESR
jgi:sortase (surface protein transpeptidase)